MSVRYSVGSGRHGGDFIELLVRGQPADDKQFCANLNTGLPQRLFWGTKMQLSPDDDLS